MTSKDLVAKAIRVKSIRTESLRANPHKPRVLFDREDMRVLRDSIQNVGILVPLTVYRESKTEHYRILDASGVDVCQRCGPSSRPGQ